MLSNGNFYHGTIKKAIVVFGNLFNNIYIERDDAQGNKQQRFKVPVSYGPKEKYLARAAQQPDIDTAHVQISLPRMAFEITSFARDPSRQMSGQQKIKTVVNGNVAQGYNPVTYNLSVSLYVMAKTQDDALQMMEQIVPYFNPTYTVTVNSLPGLGLTDDLPITLETVEHSDNYDAAFKERREVIWTFNFVMRLKFYGPINDKASVIKRTEVSFFSQPDMSDSSKIGEIDEEVTPFTANKDDNYTIVETIEGF